MNQPFPNSWNSAPVADCGVALTGGPGRLNEGLDLLIRGQIKKLVISGVHPRSQLRDIFPQLFLYPSLRLDDIILERRSETTYGNAQQTLPVIEALQCRDIILITSRIHMYRALEVFRSTFPTEITIFPYAVKSVTSIMDWFDFLIEVIKGVFYSFWAY